MARQLKQTYKNVLAATVGSVRRRRSPVQILNLNWYLPPMIMTYNDDRGNQRTVYGWAHLGANWRANSYFDNYVAGVATVWVTADANRDSNNLVTFDEIYAGCTVGGYTRGNGGSLGRNVARWSWGFPSIRHIQTGVTNWATLTRKYTIAGQEFKPARIERKQLWTLMTVTKRSSRQSVAKTKSKAKRNRAQQ